MAKSKCDCPLCVGYNESELTDVNTEASQAMAQQVDLTTIVYSCPYCGNKKTGQFKIDGYMGEKLKCLGCGTVRKKSYFDARRAQFVALQTAIPRTQKARGIKVIQTSGFNVPDNLVLSLPLDVSHKEFVVEFIEKHDSKVFARPCPTVPRHGFVDSRVITSYEQLEALAGETLLQDAQGEIVLMPPIEASKSMVLTNNSVAIGLGTDGATQGHNAITLPLAYVNVSQSLLDLAGVKDTPYFEVLDATESDATAYFVQLRDGVKPSGLGCGDWVPQDMKVKGVVEASGDALEFELAVKNAPEGTVLWHPNGTLLSHYSQHAMLRNMPIVFASVRPSVGSVLVKTAEVHETQIGDFYAGLGIGTQLSINDTNGAAYDKTIQACLVALHNASVLITDRQGALLVGMACALFLRFAYAAVLGEHRHKNRRQSLDRNTIYKRALDVFPEFKSYNKVRQSGRRARNSFYNSKWASGYGGEAWGKCADVTMDLEFSIIKFLRTPTPDCAANVVGACHNVVNVAHNNGKFLSKFTYQRNFDNAAHGEVNLIIKGMFIAYDLLSKASEVDTSKSMAYCAKWKKAAAVYVERGKKGEAKPVVVKTFKQLKQVKGVLHVTMRNVDFHFQFKPEGASDYKSASFSRYAIGEDNAQYLDEVCMVLNSTSFAGSNAQYSLLTIENLPTSLAAKLIAAKLF